MVAFVAAAWNLIQRDVCASRVLSASAIVRARTTNTLNTIFPIVCQRNEAGIAGAANLLWFVLLLRKENNVDIYWKYCFQKKKFIYCCCTKTENPLLSWTVFFCTTITSKRRQQKRVALLTRNKATTTTDNTKTSTAVLF